MAKMSDDDMLRRDVRVWALASLRDPSRRVPEEWSSPLSPSYPGKVVSRLPSPWDGSPLLSSTRCTAGCWGPAAVAAAVAVAVPWWLRVWLCVCDAPPGGTGDGPSRSNGRSSG